MEKFVLDTNLFFNMQAGLNMGKKTEDVIINLTDTIRRLKKNKKAEFYMPPQVVDEFLSFFEDKSQQILKDFLSSIVIKSPESSIMQISATIFYEFIGQTRERNRRGATIAEEEITHAGSLFLGKKTMDRRAFQETVGKSIRKFRERYRYATRFGFLDSTADLDLILLSKELSAFLVSSDEGVLEWGRRFGVKEMPVEVWKKRLEELLD